MFCSALMTTVLTRDFHLKAHRVGSWPQYEWFCVLPQHQISWARISFNNSVIKCRLVDLLTHL